MVLVLAGLACQASADLPGLVNPSEDNPDDRPQAESATPTALLPSPIKPGSGNSQEPTSIFGNIPYTSPFFVNTLGEAFVMLEDQAGFVQRNREFQFPVAGQALGPITIHPDDSLTYELALPAVPQGTFVDVDNDGETDTGVQVFAIANWSNIWGDPFLEPRDGYGWSGAYSSTVVDPNLDDEIQGGTLVIWAPDDQQSFPAGFGPDGLLFTEDDPSVSIGPGYSVVNLDSEPFIISKEARPQIDLVEGALEVSDFSDLSYADAFKAFFDKASREYPFTADKRIDWQALFDEFKPRIDQANTDKEFYKVLLDFAYAIPDGHIGAVGQDDLVIELLLEEYGAGIGMTLAELSDGRILVSNVYPGTAADRAGIKPGAEIVSWDGQPAEQAVSNVKPFASTFSTDHARRLAQLRWMTRFPINQEVTVGFKNPGMGQLEEKTLQAENDYDSLIYALGFDEDPVLPIEAEVLEPSGLGYLRINSFSDDYHLLAQLWDRYMNEFTDRQVPALVIDMRSNGGGNSGLANDFAGYFFDEELELFTRLYYNENSGVFEMRDLPSMVKPAPLLFEGPIAVLVGPDCASACEGFAYALQQTGRAVVVGHYPSAGMFGEVGRGQYNLPGDISVQFPTGRAEALDGSLIIEGSGIIPDILVPVTEDSLLSEQDAVLQAAIQALLDRIR